MSWLSIAHLLGGLVSLFTAAGIFALPKGSPRHRLLGWIYVVSLSISLVGIIIRTLGRPHPFMGYAVFAIVAMACAVLAVRMRNRFPSWKSWHGALMSLTFLGSCMAVGSIIGGVVVGDGNGPAFYRMFNGVILVFTGLGLWLINTRRVIWAQSVDTTSKQARGRFTLIAALASALLIAAQLPLAGY
jgi:uncharacterized membrane protein